MRMMNPRRLIFARPRRLTSQPKIQTRPVLEQNGRRKRLIMMQTSANISKLHLTRQRQRIKFVRHFKFIKLQFRADSLKAIDKLNRECQLLSHFQTVILKSRLFKLYRLLPIKRA